MSSGNFEKAFLNNFTIFITLKENKTILHQERRIIGGEDLVVEEEVTMQVEADSTAKWFYFDPILAFEPKFEIISTLNISWK